MNPIDHIRIYILAHDILRIATSIANELNRRAE